VQKPATRPKSGPTTHVRTDRARAARGKRVKMAGIVALALWVGLIAAAHVYYARLDASTAAEARASACLSHDGTPACTYTGDTAVLSFRVPVTADDPCTFAKGAILAADQMQAQARSPHTHAIVLLYQEDECAHQVSFDGYGESDHVTLIVTDDASGLATLTGEVRLLDRMSGEPFDMTVDLTWTAAGMGVRVADAASAESPSYRLSLQQGGTYYVSTVSGTIAEDGNAFLEGAQIRGSFGNTDTGRVTVVAKLL